MSRIAQSKEAAAQWRAARQLYLVYAALVRQFELGIEPSRELENPADRSEPEVLERVWKWFDEMDERVQVFQLRQLMQFSALATEQTLHLLIDRHLGKAAHTDADRDKVDFLLVQYYAHCVSPELSEREAEFAGVAEVLKPVLGEVAGPAPEDLRPLSQALEVLRWCRTLDDMLQNGVLEHGRRLKASIGEKYFQSAALVEFVRFNFFLRRAFFRILQTDLHAVRRTLDELEKKGHSLVDCAQAGLSDQESLAALRQKCLDWKQPFLASYSSGRLPFNEIVAVRKALELALTQPPLQPKPVETVAAPEPALPAAAPAAAIEVAKSEPQAPVAEPAAARTIAPPKPAATSKPAAVAAPAARAGMKPAPPPALKTQPPVKPAPARKAEATTQPPAPPVGDVQSCLEGIAEQLFASAGKAAAAATTVIVGKAKVVLSSWEVEAFVRGGDEASDVLQRTVAARALLADAVESRKRGGDSDELLATIALAQTEADQAQLQMEAAKKARNLDAAVNLAATAKRLLTLITEAKNLASQTPAMEMSR